MASLATHRAQEWIGNHLPACAGMLLVTKLSRGTLHISAENSIAAQECSLLNEDLRQFLQKECEMTVEEVRIVRAGR